MKSKEKLTELIRTVLTDCPEARDNDDILYYLFMKRYHPKMLGISLGAFLMASAYDKDVPNRESVGRLRRKLQGEYPDLRASEDAEFDRMVKEEEWREFAREC